MSALVMRIIPVRRKAKSDAFRSDTLRDIRAATRASTVTLDDGMRLISPDRVPSSRKAGEKFGFPHDREATLSHLGRRIRSLANDFRSRSRSPHSIRHDRTRTITDDRF